MSLEERLVAAMPGFEAEARAIAVDLTSLAARRAAGLMSDEDLARESLHVKAQTANLTATAGQALANEFRLWAVDIVTGILAKAL